MNRLVDEIVGQCYECQITTKQHVREPLKMEIPEKPWKVVSLDFGGPYPDRHYNLVVVNKRTRYPDVETLRTTACNKTKEKLRRIFSTHGTPRRVDSDNRPPFNSQEFAEEQGFKDHRIKPGHPRANGEAKSVYETSKQNRANSPHAE